MAFNKNQHFVPRAHLKPFTQNAEDVLINLFNTGQHRAMQEVPVKSQCSIDYFYGRDPKLDDAIKLIEGNYATAVRQILNGETSFGGYHRTVLLRFAYLQHLRTEAAARSIAQMTALMVDVPGVDIEIPSHSDQWKSAVQAAMLHYAESMSIVDDLKVCLVRNTTMTPFITSDNPCIIANRWYQKDPRTRNASFGVGKAGCIFLLPLSADIACIIYDGDVYSVPNQGGSLTVRKDADVDLVNEHQVLGCVNNLYFRNWDHGDYVKRLFQRTSSRRPPASHHVTLAVLGETTDWGKRYNVVARDQIKSGQDTLVHVETRHPSPSAWPSFIGFRTGGKVYSNGSGTGFVRAWCVDQGFTSGTGYRVLSA